jgi:TetR/AcrR family transcriptional repressor of nem operon
MTAADHIHARPGRPRAFDKDDAVRAMTDVFRRAGYEAASLGDLTAAAGLSRSSFYGCFGSKHGALLACMQGYVDRAMSDAKAGVAAAPDGRTGALRMVAALSGSCLASGGCLAVNCMTELAPHDPEVAAILRDHLGRMQALLARALSPEAPALAEDAAGALLSLAVGALTLRKAGVGSAAQDAVAAASALIQTRFAGPPAPG